MIILLGISRLWQFFKQKEVKVHTHEHTHDGRTHRHIHIHTESGDKHSHFHVHKLSFGVGIIHGLAGSGILIAATMAVMKTVGSSLLFLIIFSIGCIGGMIVAAGLLGLPFTKKLHSFVRIRQILIVASCVMCILLGARIMFEKLF
jgi:cytochrome c biogenesis protein CcdA